MKTSTFYLRNSILSPGSSRLVPGVLLLWSPNNRKQWGLDASSITAPACYPLSLLSRALLSSRAAAGTPPPPWLDAPGSMELWKTPRHQHGDSGHSKGWTEEGRGCLGIAWLVCTSVVSWIDFLIQKPKHMRKSSSCLVLNFWLLFTWPQHNEGDQGFFWLLAHIFGTLELKLWTFVLIGLQEAVTSISSQHWDKCLHGYCPLYTNTGYFLSKHISMKHCFHQIPLPFPNCLWEAEWYIFGSICIDTSWSCHFHGSSPVLLDGPWLDYVICDVLRSLLWLRGCNSQLEWQRQKAKPTQPELFHPWGRRQTPGSVKYRTRPLHQEFKLIQLIMVFPLNQHCSYVSAVDFDLFRNGKLQHFNCSSCWDRNKHRKNWIWPFWFPQPSLNSSGRPVWEAPCNRP